MATTADFRNGLCLELEGKYYSIVEFLHVKPGKGLAFVRTKLKNITNGRIIEKTFNAGMKVNEIRIEKHLYEFLYRDYIGYHFMHNKTFDQLSLDKEKIIGVDFLKEGGIVEVVIRANLDFKTVLFANLPIYVTLSIIYTEPGIKGDTATNTTKPATVETGAIVRVPLFINEGEKIKVDTRDGSYVERAR